MSKCNSVLEVVQAWLRGLTARRHNNALSSIAMHIPSLAKAASGGSSLGLAQGRRECGTLYDTGAQGFLGCDVGVCFKR